MTFKNIDSETLKKWLRNNEAVLVDVREPAENKAKKIPGSHLLPLATVSKESLPHYTGQKLVIHCHSGKRSLSACNKISEEDGNLEFYNLEGGILSWENSGHKVKTSGKFFLPLDRQVQVTIGLAVLISSLLGYFLHPEFFLLSSFFGLGLTFAGFSGFCGLAVLMAKMPWNKCRNKCRNKYEDKSSTKTHSCSIGK